MAAAARSVATGSRARRLEVDGCEDVPTVTSDDLLSPGWTTLPGHLICVGAGAVSLEFAQAYRRLGAQVTVVQPPAYFLSTGSPSA